MEEKRVDLRIPHPEDAERGRRQAQFVFKLNHTMPMTEEYAAVLKRIRTIWSTTQKPGITGCGVPWPH